MHLPSVVGALLVILLVIGSLVGLVAALSVPAATWAERLPEGIPRLEAHLAVLKAPIEALQKVIQQAEQVADSGTKGSVVRVHRDLGLTGALFAGTRAVLDGLFTTVLVLYFLLVSGDIFLDASSKFCRSSRTSDKPSTSLNRLRKTSRPIW